MNDACQTITIYTDGAASPNPGKGGYGAIIVGQNGFHRELSGGFRNTTNNRMEILAAIEGLKSVGNAGPGSLVVSIYTDSRYLADMFNGGYAAKWKAKGWMRNKKEKALNPDLWGELLELAAPHQVLFQWVRGHNGHPQNERCDELAVEARKAQDLPVDEGYENPESVEAPVQGMLWDVME